MAENYHRAGPQSKCPACGWGLDPEAYRCPKCRIYFCYKCRKRVQKTDSQYQCANQRCDCHGKLLCAACTVMAPNPEQLGPQEVTASGIGCAVMFSAIIVGVAGWWLSDHFSVGLVLAAAVIGAGCWWAQQPGKRWFSEYRRTYGEHRVCIACRQPVQVLRR